VIYQIAEGEWRPAQIVKVWDEGGEKRTANLVVFVDGGNDSRYISGARSDNLIHWRTSVTYGNGVMQYKSPTDTN
jgi:hypothetical protein